MIIPYYWCDCELGSKLQVCGTSDSPDCDCGDDCLLECGTFKSFLMMEKLDHSETSVLTYHTTRRHGLGDINLLNIYLP
jgi:hypothetical protein